MAASTADYASTAWAWSPQLDLAFIVWLDCRDGAMEPLVPCAHWLVFRAIMKNLELANDRSAKKRRATKRIT